MSQKPNEVQPHKNKPTRAILLNVFEIFHFTKFSAKETNKMLHEFSSLLLRVCIYSVAFFGLYIQHAALFHTSHSFFLLLPTVPIQKHTTCVRWQLVHRLIRWVKMWERQWVKKTKDAPLRKTRQWQKTTMTDRLGSLQAHWGEKKGFIGRITDFHNKMLNILSITYLA